MREAKLKAFQPEKTEARIVFFYLELGLWVRLLFSFVIFLAFSSLRAVTYIAYIEEQGVRGSGHWRGC